MNGILRNALDTGNIAGAYIIEGAAPEAAWREADEFVSALFCAAGTGCGSCPGCKKYFARNHADVMVIDGEGKSIKVDAVRDIPSFVYRKSYEGGYKAVIVAGAQDMTEQAQNALLKVLEEPPARTVFLLLAQNAKSLLPTILSRCIILDAHSNVPDAEGRIAEEFSVSTAAARVMLRAAGGDYYKARIYAENGYTEMRNDMILALGRLFYAKNMAVSVTEKLILKYEESLALAIDVALIYIKDVLGYKHTQNEGAIVNIDRIEEIKKHAMLRDRTLVGTADLLAGFTVRSCQCPGANKKLMLTGTLFDILEVTI